MVAFRVNMNFHSVDIWCYCALFLQFNQDINAPKNFFCLEWKIQNVLKPFLILCCLAGSELYNVATITGLPSALLLEDGGDVITSLPGLLLKDDRYTITGLPSSLLLEDDGDVITGWPSLLLDDDGDTFTGLPASLLLDDDGDALTGLQSGLLLYDDRGAADTGGTESRHNTLHTSLDAKATQEYFSKI